MQVFFPEDRHLPAKEDQDGHSEPHHVCAAPRAQHPAAGAPGCRCLPHAALQRLGHSACCRRSARAARKCCTEVLTELPAAGRTICRQVHAAEDVGRQDGAHLVGQGAFPLASAAPGPDGKPGQLSARMADRPSVGAQLLVSPSSQSASRCMFCARSCSQA